MPSRLRYHAWFFKLHALDALVVALFVSVAVARARRTRCRRLRHRRTEVSPTGQIIPAAAVS
jgi:hypothetical protein